MRTKDGFDAARRKDHRERPRQPRDGAREGRSAWLLSGPISRKDTMLHFLRVYFGYMLLDFAKRLLPSGDSVRDGLFRGLREQREYDRYVAVTVLLKGHVREFEQWRELRSTFKLRRNIYAHGLKRAKAS